MMILIMLYYFKNILTKIKINSNNNSNSNSKVKKLIYDFK